MNPYMEYIYQHIADADALAERDAEIANEIFQSIGKPTSENEERETQIIFETAKIIREEYLEWHNSYFQKTLTMNIYRKAVMYAKRKSKLKSERRAIACTLLAEYASIAGDKKTAAFFRNQARHFKEAYCEGLAMCKCHFKP